MITKSLAGLALVGLASCGPKEYPAMGDTDLKVFDEEVVCFHPDSLGNYTEANAEGIIRLVNGRIILKRITLPEYQRNLSMKVRVELASNGDRWDKSGSLFVLPKESLINLMNIAKGEQQFPAQLGDVPLVIYAGETPLCHFHRERFDLTGPNRFDAVSGRSQREPTDAVKQAPHGHRRRKLHTAHFDATACTMVRVVLTAAWAV